jgi:hypothetical protein
MASMTAGSSNSSVHRLRPSSGGEQAWAINSTSAAASKMCLRARIERVSPGRRRIEPLLDQYFPSSADRVDAGVRGGHDLDVVSARPDNGFIGLQQNAHLQQLAGSGLVGLDQRVDPDVSLFTDPNDLLGSGLSFPDHDASPVVPERLSQIHKINHGRY